MITRTVEKNGIKDVIYSARERSQLCLFHAATRKTRSSGFTSTDCLVVKEKREGYRVTHKAELTMGGVSIAQSHKHNKHFEEPIILQEVTNASS